MTVFRVEKTCDYTIMSNHHLKNHSITLKAKGLLSLILSLPEDWNYTTRGLAAICKEGVDSIGNALRELEDAGYIVRNKLRDDKGRIKDTEYVIYEQPQEAHTDQANADQPRTENPDMEKPVTDMSYTESPGTEMPAQLNTNRLNTKGANIHPIQSYQESMDGIDVDTTAQHRQIIMENICYDALSEDEAIAGRLDEVIDLMEEVLCSNKPYISIAGEDYPTEMVKERFMRLNSLHIQYVFECLDKNKTAVRNIKKYLLTALFNAPSTMENYYRAKANRAVLAMYTENGR